MTKQLDLEMEGLVEAFQDYATAMIEKHQNLTPGALRKLLRSKQAIFNKYVYTWIKQEEAYRAKQLGPVVPKKRGPRPMHY